MQYHTLEDCANNNINIGECVAYIQHYFLAQAPGSIEWYLIPTEERHLFVDWCKQEFFDDGYAYWKDRFEIYKLVEGKNNDREFIIV